MSLSHFMSDMCVLVMCVFLSFRVYMMLFKYIKYKKKVKASGRGKHT